MLALLVLFANFGETQIFPRQPRLNGHSSQVRRDRLEHTEHAGDRYQLCVERLAEHTRLRVAVNTSHDAPPQRPIDMHTTIRHHFRSSGNHRRKYHTGMPLVPAMASSYRLMLHESG